MKITVEMRIHRTLSGIKRYSLASGHDDKLGEILGIYDNSPMDDHLTICRNGVFWIEAGVREEICFSNIEKISIKDNDKSTDYLLINSIGKDKIIKLAVRGKNGKLSDLFEFMRFLNRVVSDLKQS